MFPLVKKLKEKSLNWMFSKFFSEERFDFVEVKIFVSSVVLWFIKVFLFERFVKDNFLSFC